MAKLYRTDKTLVPLLMNDNIDPIKAGEYIHRSYEEGVSEEEIGFVLVDMDRLYMYVSYPGGFGWEEPRQFRMAGEGEPGIGMLPDGTLNVVGEE